MREEKLSVRQLSVAAFTGGLAPAAAGAGNGWQGALLAAPVLLLAGWGLAALAPRWARTEKCWAGKLLTALYAAWGGALLARGLERCAGRVLLTGGGDPGHAPWLILLLALPLGWMMREKAAAFFRGAEICYLAMALTGAVILIWAGLKMDWSRAALPPESLWGGFLSAVETGGAFLFIIPYICKTRDEGQRWRGLGWLAALLAAGVLFPLVAAGVLSPALAAGAEDPFFLMTAALGRTARAEGLASALWLLSDLVYLGLLAQSWRGGRLGKSWLPVAATAAGAAAACLGGGKLFSPVFWSAGTAALGGITAVILAATGKNSGGAEQGKQDIVGTSGPVKKAEEK